MLKKWPQIVGQKRMNDIRLPAIMLVSACLALTPMFASAADARQPAKSEPVARPATVNRADVLAAAERLARLQFDTLPSGPVTFPARPAGAAAIDPATEDFFRMESQENPRSWHQATFWLGMTRLAERSRAAWIREAVLAQGTRLNWHLGDRTYNADDHLIGATYLWAAQNGAGNAAIAPLRAGFDRILADSPRAHLALYLGPDGNRAYPKAECLKRWCWADALFMAPVVWLKLANTTGDARYRRYALDEFRAASNFLYDPAERLYFRDSRFFDLRDPQGRKIFWSRGNGWVLAGLAHMLEALPARDPDRPWLEAHFRELASRIARFQRADGNWSSAILDTGDAAPESSGTALFTFALAWGTNAGLLPHAEYRPVALRGWQALQVSLQADGRLGWVQPAGDRPGQASASSSQIYASGAYLLAATAVADLHSGSK
jgi:unsaturated rhamnogalacturonyl hydrolase